MFPVIIVLYVAILVTVTRYIWITKKILYGICDQNTLSIKSFKREFSSSPPYKISLLTFIILTIYYLTIYPIIGTAVIWQPPNEPGDFRIKNSLPEKWLRHYRKVLSKTVRDLAERPVTCIGQVRLRLIRNIHT